jgi:mannosyl-oligosaccharide alpha-1,2-mannosidase
MYDAAARAAIKHTLFKPYTLDEADILVPGEIFVDDNGKFYPRLHGEHLGCYAGGMFALGGMLTDNERHLEVGRKLTWGCIWAYKNSPLGIMPETFSMLPCPKSSKCRWNQQKYRDMVRLENDVWLEDERMELEIVKMSLRPGFTSVPDRRYLLRPEAIESVFILYRITGDPSLLEAAWDMFTSIEKHTKTTKGNAALADVLVASDSPKEDRMESFWMAETLKYFYLVFSEPSLISLDEYVFNTRGHPFKRPV